MEHYETTRQNYEIGADWHAEKSLSYDWRAQMDAFSASLPPSRGRSPLRRGEGPPSQSARVLDAGCGAGRDIEEFRKRGMAVDGIGFSGQAIRKLRAKFPDARLYEADMRSTGLLGETYDGVWACASILNLKKEDVPAALEEFKRLLKPNGKLFISVKEGEGERMVPDRAGERFFSFFSEEELRRLAEQAGFAVTRTELVDDQRFTGKEVQPPPPRWICLYAVKK